jgi:hypothetical protein
MTRNLTALGVALVAVIAASAVMASGASAFNFHFNSEAADSHTFFKGTQTAEFGHKFTTTAGEVTCKEAEFSGTSLEKTTTDLTLTPTYKNCHLNIFGSKVSAEVATNGCTYTFTSHQTSTGVTTPITVHIVCPEGAQMGWFAPGCHITIGPQTLTGVTITNQQEAGKKKHVKVALNIKNIKYSHTGFSCGTGSGTIGTTVGEFTLRGSSTVGGEVGISYDAA